MKPVNLIFVLASSGLLSQGCDHAPRAIAEMATAVDLAALDQGVQIARGRYLVETVGACADCHTPRLPITHAFDPDRTLAGVDCFIDADPSNPEVGCLSTPNLTNHNTGLKNRSRAEIKDMFLKGERPDGTFLQPTMPYATFGNMSDSDADAIVAFLRTLPAVDHTVKSNQIPFTPPERPAPRFPEARIPVPRADYSELAAAQRGKYLAGNIGICMECHTARDEAGLLRVDAAFQGGNRFARDGLGLPPTFPEFIYASNITPDATGIAGWTTDDIVAAIKQGIDKQHTPLCPPMPAGPMGVFGGFTDADARDIAHYLLAIEPQNNSVPVQCVVPASDTGSGPGEH